jgi:hypothetical protein
MLGAYSRALQTAPLVTKSSTAAILFGIGDSLAQWTTAADEGGLTASRTAVYDARRAAAFMAFGGAFYAPTQHFWFAWMERNVAAGASWTVRPLRQASARVGLHSLVYAPFSIASLFVWMDLFATGDPWAALAKAQPATIIPIWLAGGSFWIPTMLVIYRFVPLHARVVVTSVSNVAWSTYLSLKRAGGGHQKVTIAPLTRGSAPSAESTHTEAKRSNKTGRGSSA